VQAPHAQLNDPSLQIENQQIIIVQAPLAQLSWYHHLALLDKVKDPAIRQFYITKAIENGWSRNVMVHQIESDLHNRQGALITNFNKTVAPEQSELGISEYKITQGLPENIKGELPSIEELEQKMDEELNESVNPVDARLKAVKDKLKKITNEEIQTPVTFPILTELYNIGLRPLYQLIIEKFTGFNELFHDNHYEWYLGNKHIENLQLLDEIWRGENELQKSNELFFEYRLSGFRKAGTENFSAQIQLRFEINTYWYGISIKNDNNHQPFLKKLYHQGLNDEDNQNVIDYVTNNMLDQVEWIVGRVEETVEK